MRTFKIFLTIMVIMMVARAYALEPMAVPEELQQEAANTVVIHKGECQTPTGQELCMVGYDQATDTFWMLLFNQQGVLFQVVEIKGDNQSVRWTHPNLHI